MYDHFYGYPLSSMNIDGLYIQIEEQSETTLKLVCYDKKGAKWEIRPVGGDGDGSPTRLSLYHRSNTGRMHYQGRSKKIGRCSVERLLADVASHEEHEVKQRERASVSRKRK